MNKRQRSSGVRQVRLEVVAKLEAALRDHPLALVTLQTEALARLAEMERDRGGIDWVENHIGRLRALDGLAMLAEKERARAHRYEAMAVEERRQAMVSDHDLLPKVEQLRAAGEPVKVIRDMLKISKDRYYRIDKLRRERATIQARAEATRAKLRGRSG